eukprot:gene28266-37191_t
MQAVRKLDADDRDKRSEFRRDKDWDRGRERTKVEPSHSVMIKGLPSHTTEPVLHAALAIFSPKEIRLITQRDGGECKGFSFAEFHTVEHAQYFMATYPGSWLHNYDPNGPQLIIENRAVQLEYARDRDRAPPHHSDREHRGGGSGSVSSTLSGVSHGQADWLCNACSCHNFARREQCFRCSALRPQNSELVIIGDLASSGSSALSLVASDVPSAYLVIRGFNQLTVRDEHLMELLRQFAVVKSVTMLPAGDPTTNYSTGMAFVEFHTVDHASYTLKCTAENGLTIDGIQLKVSYAKESMMAQIIQHQNHQLFAAAAAAAAAATTSSGTSSASASASYAAAALQAAQWSMNNAFAGAIGAPVPMADPYAVLLPGAAMLPPGMGMGGGMMQVPPVKSKKSKWPPTFESQGGAYVFQAKTGYFLEPATNFYFCPKSKLYFNGSDGIYYRLKQTHTPDIPAVELFEPPLPCETDLSSEAAAVKAPSSETSSTKTIIKLNPIKLASSTTTSTSASSSSAFSQQDSKAESKSAFSMSIAPGAAAPVAGKKVLKDILKWGALQKEEEEEQQLQAEREKEKQANKLKQKKGEIADSYSRRDDSDSNSHSGAPRAHKAPNVEAIKPPQPPPPPVPAPVPQIPAIPAPVASGTAAAAVCLLCRRQFPSFEVLQRHERESKLHLENLRLQLEKETTKQ